MKKRLVSAMMVGTMLAGALTGCGGSSGGDAAPAATKAAGAESSAATADVAAEDEHTLSVYAWDKNFNIPALEAAEKAYQKKDPEFKLNIIEQSQSSDIENAVTLAASAGDYTTLADIVLFQDHYFNKFVTDYPEAWQDVEGIDVNWDDFSQEKLSYSTIDGKHYGLPVDNGTVIAAYRTDLLEQAGYTIDDLTGCSWEKFDEIGKKVYETSGKYSAARHDDPAGGDDHPAVPARIEGEAAELCLGLHPADHFDPVYDHDVPPELAELPGRYHGGCPYRRTERGTDFLPHVYAGHEVDLCCSRRYHVYERVECVPVAEGRHDEERSADDADADREPRERLLDRLRRPDARCPFLLDPDDDHLLHPAEAVRRRYHRCREVRKS